MKFKLNTNKRNVEACAGSNSAPGDFFPQPQSAQVRTADIACFGAEERLRKHCWGQKVVYVHTTKKKTAEHEELVTERQINQHLYEMMLPLADPERNTIDKTRHSFIWRGQYFEVDTYHAQLQGLVMLETKGIAEGESLNLPPFLEIVKEVTGCKDYYNYNLALK